MFIVNFIICFKVNEKFGKVVDMLMICVGYGGSSMIFGCYGDSGGLFVC